MGSASNSQKIVEIQHGIRHFPGALSPEAQSSLLAEINQILHSAPLFKPRMPRTGKPFSVEMSNCGPLGWVSDKENGYRYQPQHPETNNPWPPIPAALLNLWSTMTPYDAPPEACLINKYQSGARMGLHRDDDENEPAAPIFSLSLGDDAWFRIGGLKRNDPTSRIKLKSGDVITMSGPARFTYHGIDRILPGTSKLLPKGGRINLTLRRVTPYKAIDP